MPHAHHEALSELPGAAMPTALIEGLPLGAWEMDIATDCDIIVIGESQDFV